MPVLEYGFRFTDTLIPTPPTIKGIVCKQIAVQPTPRGSTQSPLLIEDRVMKCMVIESCSNCPNSVLVQRPFSCRTTGVTIPSEIRNGIAVCGGIPAGCPLPDIDSVQVDMTEELKKSPWAGLVPSEPPDAKAIRRRESQDLLKKAGIQFEVKNSGVHLIVVSPSGLIDFWPGPGKWTCRTGMPGFGGINGLIEFIQS